MKNLLRAVYCGGLFCVIACSVLCAQITQQLHDQVGHTAGNELLPIKVILKQQVSMTAASQSHSLAEASSTRQTVVQQLKSAATPSQQELSKFFEQRKALEVGVSRIKYLWIVNAVALNASPSVIEELSKRPEVERVDLDQPRKVIEDISWGVSKVNADQVWTNPGSKGAGVIVAVIDTGVDLTHTDIKNHLWVNHNEIPGDGIDNDKNGYIDDVNGYNFSGHNSDPTDDQNHGTHVTGTIVGDGSAGTKTGVAPEAKVMALKVLDSVGNGKETDVWEGIQYAVENGANIISMSLGWKHSWNPDRNSWRQVCQNAIAAGVVVIVAAGNDGEDASSDQVRTPGDVPGVITVAATDNADHVASFSSRGPVSWATVSPYNDFPNLTKPDVAAPGVLIKSTMRGGGYVGDQTAEPWSGTSMATPHVSGVAALMIAYAKSKNMKISPADVKACLEKTAVHLGTQGKNNEYGSGRIDAVKAVQCAAGN
jgi:serine protease AprX